MSHETPLERLGRALEAAAEREIAGAPSTLPSRRWRRGSLATLGAVLMLGAGAAAWAATALFDDGAPVPFAFGAPVAGQGQGAPLPDTVKLLADGVADPGGGLPWGMRYWETDRKFACLQVGRLYQGKLGQITGTTFHELRVGVTGGALGGCYALDGSGHAYAAVHTDARQGAQDQPCPEPARTSRTRGRSTDCDVSLDFGLLGPNAASFTYRAGERQHTATPLGGVGGYLVVQKRLPTVTRVVGFHHKDPRLDFRMAEGSSLSVTPASSRVLRRVRYAAGVCTVHRTNSIFGACYRQAGYVPIPQPAIADVRSPVRVSLLGDGRSFRVRFRARQAVVDGRSAYNIQIRPKGGRATIGQSYQHNLAAGELVSTTFRARPGWHGTWEVIAQFRTVRARPGPIASPASPGLLVGRAQVTLR